MLYRIKKLIRKLIPKPLLNLYHGLYCWLANFIYKFPGKDLIIIGVTGTKGKTTTAYLIWYFLQSLGIKSALASGLCFCYGEIQKENKLQMTMPGRGALAKFLKTAKDKNCQVAVIEVTSEGLEQNRHWGINFDIAVFTKLAPEHIEAHGGYQKYKSAKGKLFKTLNRGKRKNFQGKLFPKTIVVNLDDPEKDYFLSFPAEKKIGFSLKPKKSFSIEIIYPDNFSVNAKGLSFQIEKEKFFSPLIGEFNLYNILSAFSVIKALGFDLSKLKKPLQNFTGLPGRFEILKANKIKVIIDYAHTPDSYEAVYQTIWRYLKPNQLTCIIGSDGGGRDHWKRPEIGKLAAKYCQKIIITDVNPYDEDPQKILKEIYQGCLSYLNEFGIEKDIRLISDRYKAIESAIKEAKSGTCILIAQKGSEPYIIVKDKKIPWSDRQVAENILKELKLIK